MYSLLVRPLLFSLDPETAHELTMRKLHFASKKPWLTGQIEKYYGSKVPQLKTRCMGLDFSHPIGLAAGLDKDAKALPAFSALGFSGVELGTVTPKPQPGNDKPRMFRLLEDQALINRMGFNSAGLDGFLENLQRPKKPTVVGINIGKNAATSIDNAYYDYVAALQRVYSHADYITINISSPNTKSLRDLQNANFLDNLLAQIKRAHSKCEAVHKRSVPIALKVAPDLNGEEIETIAELVMSYQFDAVIASNTTVSRPSSLGSRYADESGGLSGPPVADLSTKCIKEFYRLFKGSVEIIGSGGISNADDAWEKLIAGANYLQIYTAFIYQGPSIVADLVKGLEQKVKSHGFDDLATAMIGLRDR